MNGRRRSAVYNDDLALENEKMRPLTNRLTTALAACLLLWACGEAASVESGSTAEAAQTVASTEAAPDFALETADGDVVRLSDYTGEVVLVNFWATWCGPCKIEMPWFIEFQRKYKDRGFRVIAISLDEEGWDVVRPYAEDLQANFPIVLGDKKTEEAFGGVAALPTTFIIDKQGIIHNRHTGLVSKGDYEDEIESLL